MPSRKNWHRRAGLFLLSCCVPGCTEHSATMGFVQRDSAGIVIVESSAPAWDPGEVWVVDTDPILDLTTSGTGEAHFFFLVSDATRLPDGTIVVADNGSDEIRFFSPEGEFIDRVGGSGEGPGEFRWPQSVDRFRGDSLLVFDPQLGRVTILDPSGQVGRVYPVRLPGAQIWNLLPLDGSTLVARAPLIFEPEERDGPYRRPDALVRFSASGGVMDTVAVVAGNEDFQWEAGGLSAVPLFVRDTHHAVFGGILYTGDADEMEFKEISPEGEVLRITRVPGYDLGTSAEEIRAERDARLEMNPSERNRGLLAAMPDPVTRPAYADLLVDSEGFLWALESQGRTLSMTGGQPSTWNVFSPDGEWLGRVETPFRFFVFEVGRDYVLGRRYDEHDVECVELLSLIRT